MEYGDQIFQFISTYGYWIMLPLMIVEGPIATLVAALFASLGAFNVYVVLLFSIIGDIIGDILFYYVGYRHGTYFIEKTGRFLKVTKKRLKKIRNYFDSHGGKTIFLVKSTTGLGWITFMVAGATKMDFKKFVGYSFLGGIVWSGFLVLMGYFYGYIWRETSEYIEWIGWFISGIAVLSFLVIYLYKKRKTRKIFNGKA